MEHNRYLINKCAINATFSIKISYNWEDLCTFGHNLMMSRVAVDLWCDDNEAALEFMVQNDWDNA